MVVRFVTVLFATLLAALAAVPAALATEITAQQDSSRWVRVKAADGEQNRLTVTREGQVVVLRDPAGGLDSDATCVEVDSTEVRCTITSGEPRVSVELVDGDDEITVLGALEAKVDGGAGNDTVNGGDAADELQGGDGDDKLNGGAGVDTYDGGEGADVVAARDALRETVACGGGDDRGDADLEDDVSADCEALSRPLPPPGLDGVQPPGDSADPAGPADGGPGSGLVDAAGRPIVRPVAGRSVSAYVKSGEVLARVPGVPGYAPVDPAKPLPVGSVVDATDGVLTMTAASDRTGGTQTANFAGGRFVVAQTGGSVLTTELRLAGGDFSRCATAPSANGAVARAAGRRSVRKLWGSGKGRFRTRGRNSSATVRGTVWQVVDRCDGTLTRVTRGVVAVKNHRTGRTRLVRAGQSVFVPRATPRRRR